MTAALWWLGAMTAGLVAWMAVGALASGALGAWMAQIDEG